MPGEGREIVLPTQFVLPSAPHEGLVINLAQLRVFYYPKVKDGELQRAPVGRSLVMAGLGLLGAVWALASLLVG